MQYVRALPLYRSMQLGDSDLGFFSVLRSFLSAGNDALGPNEPSERVLSGTEDLDLISVAVGDQQHNAAIKRDNGFSARCWNCDINFARDYGKPLIRPCVLAYRFLVCPQAVDAVQRVADRA